MFDGDDIKKDEEDIDMDMVDLEIFNYDDFDFVFKF